MCSENREETGTYRLADAPKVRLDFAAAPTTFFFAAANAVQWFLAEKVSCLMEPSSAKHTR